MVPPHGTGQFRKVFINQLLKAKKLEFNVIMIAQTRPIRR